MQVLYPAKYPLVSNKRRIRHVKCTINAIFGLKGEAKYIPSSNPVSLESRHLSPDILDPKQYIVSYKVDGVRYLLLLTKDPQTLEPFACMIDRSLRIFEVRVQAPKSFFMKGMGTLFDGELTFFQNKQNYYAFDLIYGKGESYLNQRYRDRFIGVVEMISKMKCLGNFYSLNFQVRKCFAMRELETLIRNINQIAYKEDGFIFTPGEKGIQLNRDETLFKWKPNHEQTVDLRGIPDDPQCYDKEVGKEIAIRSIEFLSGYQNAFMFPYVESKSDEIPSDDDIAEYQILIDHQFKQIIFKFVRLRGDKSCPNAKDTVLRTFQSLQDSIALEEILNYIKESI